MTAVVLAPDLNGRGGAESVAVRLAGVLRDLGYRVVMITPTPVTPGAISAQFDVDVRGIEVIGVPLPGRWAAKLPHEIAEVRFEYQCKRIAKRCAPQVFVNTLFGVELASIGNVNIYYVHFPHAAPLVVDGAVRGKYYSLARRLRRRLSASGANFCEAYEVVLANSQFTAENVHRLWGVSARVLYPPVDIKRFDPSVHREKTIVSVGRFEDAGEHRPHKQQDLLIEVFSRMHDLIAEGWQLHLVGSVGSGEELERLERMSEGLPIYFHPDLHQEKLQNILQRSSIYWHAQGYGAPESSPLMFEHFGISVVEAMGAGVIPLVYGKGGPAEIVAPLPSPRTWLTHEELASTTREIAFSDDHSRNYRRQMARRRAQEFAPSRFAAEIAQILASPNAAKLGD